MFARHGSANPPTRQPANPPKHALLLLYCPVLCSERSKHQSSPLLVLLLRLSCESTFTEGGHLPQTMDDSFWAMYGRSDLVLLEEVGGWHRSWIFWGLTSSLVDGHAGHGDSRGSWAGFVMGELKPRRQVNNELPVSLSAALCSLLSLFGCLAGCGVDGWDGVLSV